MTAAIIGGGIAGLAAAYELVKAGERPYVIEAGPIGGMVRSVTRDGFTLECGPNVLVERPDLKELFQEIGLAGEAVHPSVNPYGQYVWYRGRPVKVPANFFQLLGSPLFTGATKLLLPVKALLPGVLPGKVEDCSVEQFFTPLLGRHAARNLIDPVLKGIYGGDVGVLSARSLFPGLWGAATEGKAILGYMRSRSSGGKPPIAVIRGGIQRLTDALWREVRPHVEHIKAQVQRITPLDSKRFRISLPEGRQIEADGCIVTAAGRRLAPLVGYLNEELADTLTNVKYATLTVVHLRVPRSEPLIPAAFGVLFPGGMPEDLLGVMFNSQIFPHMAPAHEHLLTVVLGGAQAGERTYDEATLKEKLPEMLRTILGISHARWLAMTQWPAAIPQLEVGHHKLVKLLDQCEYDHPGIVFAGVDRGGVGVSDRIRLAREAVKRFRRVRVETVV
jgi:oxygen-dependent protoporphyrinogen oxidase